MKEGDIVKKMFKDGYYYGVVELVCELTKNCSIRYTDNDDEVLLESDAKALRVFRNSSRAEGEKEIALAIKSGKMKSKKNCMEQSKSDCAIGKQSSLEGAINDLSNEDKPSSDSTFVVKDVVFDKGLPQTKFSDIVESDNQKSSFTLDLQQFQKEQQPKNYPGVKYIASHKFTVDDYIYVMVVMIVPYNLWWLKPEFINKLFTAFGESLDWMTTFSYKKQRKEKYGENKVARKAPKDGQPGYPKEVITFRVKIEKANDQIYGHLFHSIIGKIHNTFTRNPESVSQALFTWLGNNQAPILDYFRNKGKKDEDIKVMFAEEIKGVFSSKRETRFDASLDMYLLDWDIKEFFTEFCGLYSWPEEDGEGSGMKRIFRKFPAKNPAFESIENTRLSEL